MSYLNHDDLTRCAEIVALTPSLREMKVLAVAEDVSAQTGIPLAAITGQSRLRYVAHARQLCFFIAHRSGFTLPEIGRVFSRDHTTVLHGIRAEHERRERMKP